MTAPAEEIVEQDLARDDAPHVFCPNCYPPGPRARAKAMCGTLARQRGQLGYPPDLCLVCIDLWEAAACCPQCGKVPY